MPLKLSRTTVKAMMETIHPADKARVILQNLDGSMFYLIVGDNVIGWSSDKAEIEAAAGGQFRLEPDTGYITPPPVRVTFTVDDYAEMLAERNRRIAAVHREHEKFEHSLKRLKRAVTEMLVNAGKRDSPALTEMLADIKAINKRLGLAKMTDATTREHLQAYGAWLGSWKLKEKAGLL